MVDLRALNAWLDRWPTPPVRVGGRRWSPYTLTAVSGLLVGSLCSLAVAAASGASLVVQLGALALLVCTYLAWGQLRRRWTGEESHVLLELVLLGLLVEFLALRACGVSPWPYLDATAVGLAVGLGIGRTGCARAGCCHGDHAALGIWYSARFPPGPGRRFPVQLLEAAAWWLLALLALPVLLSGAAGLAASLILSGYGLVRGLLEPVRGDVRPHLAGRSASTWLSLVSLGAGLALAGSVHPLQAGEVLFAVGTLAVAGLMLAGPTRWVTWPAELDPTARAALHQLGARLASQLPGPHLVTEEIAGVRLAASWVVDPHQRASLIVSVSEVDEELAGMMLASVAAGLEVDDDDLVIEAFAGDKRWFSRFELIDARVHGPSQPTGPAEVVLDATPPSPPPSSAWYFTPAAGTHHAR